MNTYQCINDIITEDERKQLLSEAMNFKWWNDKFSFQVLEFYLLYQKRLKSWFLQCIGGPQISYGT